MRRTLLLAALLALPGALTACPVAADLGAGITVRDQDGTIHHFTRTEDGGIEERQIFTDGYETLNTLIGGLYVTSIFDVFDGRIDTENATTITYTDPDALPDPRPNLSFSVPTIVRVDDETFEEIQVYELGAPRSLRIGDCRYEAVPIDLRYLEGGEEVYLETLDYLPALGLSLVSSYDDGTDRIKVRAIAISAP